MEQNSPQAMTTRITLSDYNAKVRELQHQAMTVFVTRFSLSFAAFWCFVWGTIVLVLRSIWGTEAHHLAWGGLGLVAAVGLAGWWARRWVPSQAQLRALVDRQSHCGGLLMAANEVQMGQWERHIPQSSLPTFTWKSQRAWGILTLAFLYTGVSFLMPQQFLQPVKKPHLHVDSQVKALKKQIKVLQEEKVVSKLQAKQWTQKLNRIQKQASGKDPAKTWQALDHLSQKLQQKARKAAEKALANTEKWAKNEQLAKTLSKMAGQMKPSEMSKHLKKLSKQMKSMMSSNHGKKAMSAAKVSKAMAKAMSSSSMKMSHLKMAAGMCKSGRMISKKMLAKLIKAGLVGKGAMKMHGKFSKKAMGKAMLMYSPMSKGGSSKGGSKPGSGGITRGGGSAPLTWKSPSKAAGAKFKPIVLSPSQLANLRRSQVVGLSVGDPTKQGKPGQGSAGQGLQNQWTHQSSGRTQVIFPQHRGTVQRYFQRGKP